MKKIIGNNEAVVRNVAIGAIVVVAIIIVAAFFVMTGGPTEYWETEVEFGTWGQEIILEYEDGTTQSLKILYDNVDSPLSVWHGGQKVTSIMYKIKEKATSVGYDWIKFDLAGFTVTARTKQGSTVVNTYTRTHSGSVNPNYAIDGNWHGIWEFSNKIGGYFPSSLSPGTYTLQFSHSGTIKYSGRLNGVYDPYISASLPPTLTITMEVRSDNSLSVVLGSGYTIS
ncbi:unnamed protein product [marine sediment metagenome]|uniref:Uncharacterized protein n=1 Tax=marine sediment metagenome TaxID=412755 RepID=X1BXR1_9ZZZZ